MNSRFLLLRQEFRDRTLNKQCAAVETITADNFVTTSGTATSTFAGGVSVGSTGLLIFNNGDLGWVTGSNRLISPLANTSGTGAGLTIKGGSATHPNAGGNLYLRGGDTTGGGMAGTVYIAGGINSSYTGGVSISTANTDLPGAISLTAGTSIWVVRPVGL